MSLGVKLLWRAQVCTRCVKGLSLIPRESHNLPFLRQPENTRRWLSTSPGGSKPPLGAKTTAPVADDPRLPVTLPSPYRRRALRRIIRKRSKLDPEHPVLVRRAVHYPKKHATRRSLRKRHKSAARQHLHDQTREAASKPPHSWRSTLDFMLRHTPKYGEVLDFKVVIGQGAAEDAREVLSGPDTNLQQITRKHSCRISIEETIPHGDVLVLGLSGPEISVRKSLLELVRIFGKLTAIRALDPAGRVLLSDAWEDPSSRRLPLRLLAEGEVSPDNTIMTVSRSSYPIGGPFKIASQQHKDYMLERRADLIPQPAEWTKKSFERYVAALVHGQVPTHLANQLYPGASSHQETVVSLLLDVFAAENTRLAVSVSALKLALKFIQMKGSPFRPAARALFHQAELLGLPLDTETFNAFLLGASRMGDLDGFNSVIRSMVRKHCSPQSRSWLAFLEMIKDPRAKRYVISKMRVKGLNRLPSVLTVMGRHAAMINLEDRGSGLPADFNARLYVEEYDRKYGSEWLDTVTLNKILDILGSQRKREASQELLDSIYSTRRLVPDIYTFNTIITHSRSVRQQISTVELMETRWPSVRPDDATFDQLFRTAWKQRLPNMLRVVWQYAVLARATTAKMRYNLFKLLRQEYGLSENRALSKAWEDVIAGQAELAEIRKIEPKDLRAGDMMAVYIKAVQGMRARDKLAAKLQEAYEMDLKIHGIIREGKVMSTSLRESLSVDIPLEAKPHFHYHLSLQG